MRRLRLLSIKPSTRKDKKYMALFSDGTLTHFGQKRYEDFTMHKDPERKQRYLLRHISRENWNNPISPGALSRWILWNKPTVEESLKDYIKKFNLL